MSTNDNVLRSTIILCALAALCEGVDLQAAGVAASGIAPEFKPTPGQLGTFFSASTFGLLFGALVGGRLADSVGRKAVLVASIGLFGICSLLTALAWNMPSLAWARLLTGLGLGGALPNLIALQIGFNVGGALAALLMGHLLEGRWRMLSLAVTFAALPVLILMLGKAPAQVSVIVPLVCALGCAILAAQAFLYAMAPAIYPISIRGIGVGAAVAVGRIGSVVGPKLGGTLRAAGHSSAQLFLDILPVVIVGSICALMLASYSPKASRALSD
jgi:MFS family permease